MNDKAQLEQWMEGKLQLMGFAPVVRLRIIKSFQPVIEHAARAQEMSDQAKVLAERLAEALRENREIRAEVRRSPRSFDSRQ